MSTLLRPDVRNWPIHYLFHPPATSTNRPPTTSSTAAVVEVGKERKAERALFIEAPRRNNVAAVAGLQIKRPKEFGSGVISLCAGLRCGKFRAPGKFLEVFPPLDYICLGPPPSPPPPPAPGREDAD
ncbi:hypothetical protein GWI33_006557 [Rhynchophorus ferrugineus]|uniref:Uncharacterized protein n=1 Tax=Rhynchophorus ferrugineus TaxID=354439 RepID=A0A834IWF0_RHYFE|nr:hypothetical protein GWI33_006557 [Rhynchophorus ferrugineus]